MMDEDSLGRHGLASSCSCLDGVPFKIGPKFRPPPKVIYQPVIEDSCRSNGLHEEYTFETEEAVLAWAKAREEALKKASIEQANKASKAVEANSGNGKNRPEDDGKQGTTAGSEDKDGSGDPNKVRNPAQRNENKKPLVPKTEPNAILKPTPIQHLNKDSDQNGPDPVTKSNFKSAVDVSMFERVDDPFDAVELQTLDDMEELKVLLDSSSSKYNEEENQASEKTDSTSSITQKDNSTESFYELATPIATAWVKFDDAQEHFPDTQTVSNVNSENLIPSHSPRSSESPSSDIGDYVDIVEEGLTFQPLNTAKQVPSAESAKPTNLHTTNGFSGLLPKLDSTNGIYKQVLPPIPMNHSKLPNGIVEMHSTEENGSAIFHGSVSASANTTSISQSNEGLTQSNTNVTNPKPARIAPPPPATKPKKQVPTPRPRSSGQVFSSGAASYVDSMESSSKPAEEQTLNPFNLHSMNITNPEAPDNPSQSSITQLNRYRPLPPPPSPRSKVEKGSQSLGLSDPYTSLSREAQEFTNRVTSMGFLRAKVARAVEKFGQDEKEVLDHLFAVDMLVEKKYAPIHAEAALQLCKNDLDKAERLLILQSQLEELGFNSESVRNALIKSDLDHDKALDLLTA